MTPCDHLQPDEWPLTIEHAFTMMVVFADALVRCRSLATDTLLWTDSRANRINGVLNTDMAIPVEPWQVLPCDGAWFKRLNLIAS